MLGIPKHPFAVEAFFENSLVLSYAVPKHALQHMIPECLELDTFADKWAFLAVAMVATKNLRPKGFPKFLGNNFFLIGYRIFVRYRNEKGKRLRGLYILKSETDRYKMSFLGNIFTHYNYTQTDIHYSHSAQRMHVSSKKSALDVQIGFGEEILLPRYSPFTHWKEARRFAGPMPFTFTYNKAKQEVFIIEGIRQNWLPKPVEVIRHEIEFIKELALKDTVLANAFVIQNIPYMWKKGKSEPWIHPSEVPSRV